MPDKTDILHIAAEIESVIGQADQNAAETRMRASAMLKKIARGRLRETRYILRELFQEGYFSRLTKDWLDDRFNEEGYLN